MYPHPCARFPSCVASCSSHYIVFKQLQLGLKKESEAEAHGSILMVEPMLNHGEKFMEPRFDETCVDVMNLRNHSSK